MWGVSNYFIADIVDTMLPKLKSEFDKNGRPLPDLPNEIHHIDKFYPKKFNNII